ncbi:Holin family protein [Clostridium perfringens]|uniref:phage holin family protein n=1 Tax=Clostridium perfringens TaxID=1502 RepID=UPI001CB1FF64|nr:phage holin family protein [Clostridium perfringens]MDG6879909.1 Holin family protein [Clostridium perfringens]MDM0459694.1 phage holin family protein [Clostridium perfringens]HBI7033930.1 phage holin family protein [Clostridium perfringens]HBI7048016.1 phage holin family protein [Clostridium perfringens]HBI7053194.1 phage holin family protein [Clostridium perfringens]
MERIFDYLKLIVVALGTGFTWLFGAWDTPLVVLIVFMVLDYITGLTRGYLNKELSSSVGLKGIARKAIIFIVLIVAVMLDRLLNTGNWVFRTVSCYFYIANEGISLLENAASLGVPIPEKVKGALIQLRDGKKKDSFRENIEHRQ